MRYLSVCSGIEAATVAWHPLGWEAAAFSEIEAFPRAVLQHHYPDTPLHGDFTTIGADDYGAIDLLVGGTPCQSFSVAGLRKGLADERGNLALEYLRLADRKSPRWLVWENVPGVLSSNDGRDFGAFLGGLVELGYGFAYRVLDAQFFGVPQRRRRVFVVGCLGDWRRAAAVLFERHSLSGNPPPRREKGPSVAALTANGVGTCGADDNQGQAGHLIAFSGQSLTCNGDVAPTLDTGAEHHNRGIHCFTAKDHGADRSGSHSGSHANGGVMPAVCFSGQMSEPSWSVEQAETLQAKNPRAVAIAAAVRRLTPRECERLQGFPDDYTLIPYRGKQAADGPRYKALGNSMAVPVMRWIGERIEMVEQIQAQERAA